MLSNKNPSLLTESSLSSEPEQTLSPIQEKGLELKKKIELLKQRSTQLKVSKEKLPTKTPQPFPILAETPISSKTTLVPVTSLAPQQKEIMPVTAATTISAVRLLEDKFTSNFVEENYSKSRRELQMALLISSFVLVIVSLGWLIISNTNFLADGNFIYNSGLTGGILMLLSVFYSVARRLKVLKKSGRMDIAYYTHLVFGASGALLIVFHSSYEIRSINAAFAFCSMVLVVISGALGRYMYTRFSFRLHLKYLKIKNVEPLVFNAMSKFGLNRCESINERFAKFTLYCLKVPENHFEKFGRFFTIVFYGGFCHLRSIYELDKILKNITFQHKIDSRQLRIIQIQERHAISRYSKQLVSLGYTILLEHLFRHWRILHIPLLYLLALTTIFHVIAVHMY